ncbi:MAG: TRAP transporter small permease [Beijerinckiaceae bacterium]|jgi:TRAP-type C4-dicarboxylate transport system permease small subunit|nr:TRAP transporter small permease [Beijerinckiaceae bacterium]
MDEPVSSVIRPADPAGRILFTIARILAICGGILLCVVAALVSISVFGRSAFSMPVPGDFELVAIGTGISVFAMLPYCQMVRGNVLVDFFMSKAPVRFKAACDLVGNIAFFIIATLLTWRMVYGGIDMYTNNEKSMTINFPRWTTFPVSVLLMGFLSLVIAYTIWRSIQEMKQNRFLDPQ